MTPPLCDFAQHELLDLAGRVLRNWAEHYELWHLVAGHLLAAELADLSLGCRCIWPQFDEGARHLAPFRVRLGHHRRRVHRRMAVQNVFDLDRGDVLAPGNDHVLRAILDAHVPIRLDHGEIPGVEPAAGESLFRGRGVLQIAVHRDVAAEHDLADGLPIRRHRLHRGRVEDRHRVLHRAGDALARVQPGALGQRQRRPFLMLRAHRRGAIGFGQAVHVGDVEADALHALDNGSRGSGAGDEAADLAAESAAQFPGALINML